MKKLLIGFVLCMISFIGMGWDDNDYTMHWQVKDEGNRVNDGPNDVYTFLGFDHADDEIGVRIACYDKDGTFIKYLNPAYPDPINEIDWDYNDQIIGTRDDLALYGKGQAYYGPSDYSEKLFQLQVGNYDGEDNFVALLYSKMEKVDGRYWYDWGTLAPFNGEWTPIDFYTYNPPPIPEPSAGLLLLVGMSLLNLKRKKQSLIYHH